MLKAVFKAEVTQPRHPWEYSCGKAILYCPIDNCASSMQFEIDDVHKDHSIVAEIFALVPFRQHLRDITLSL